MNIEEKKPTNEFETFKPKIIFFDIDDTLIHNFYVENISKSDLEALQNLQKENIFVVLATGRSEKDSLKLQNLIRVNNFGDFVVVENGSKIIKYPNQVLKESHIEDDDFEKVLKYGEKNKYVIKCSNLDILFTNDLVYRKIVSNLSKRFTFKKYSEMKKYDFTKDNKAKVGFYFWNKKTAQKEVEKITKELSDFEVVLTGGDRYIEVNKKEVNKKTGSDLVLKELNLTYDQAMAFGDSLNDLPLFEKVKYSVAVANATNKLIKKANFTTLEVENSGVSYFINKYILKK